MAYSKKFRLDVVKFSLSGNSIRKTSKVFNVANSQICNWRNKYKNGEGLEDKIRDRKHLRKITPEKLENLLVKRPDAIQKEMAEEFDCNKQSVSVALRKFNYSRKKNKKGTWKRVPKSERNTGKNCAK